MKHDNNSIRSGSVLTNKFGKPKAEWVAPEQYYNEAEDKQNSRVREKRKSAQSQMQDEWAELAAEETLFRKFKKGKVSKEDYEDALLNEDGPEVDSDGEVVLKSKGKSKPDSKVEPQKGTKRQRDGDDDSDEGSDSDGDSDDDNSAAADSGLDEGHGDGMSDLSDGDDVDLSDEEETPKPQNKQAGRSQQQQHKKTDEKNVFHHGFNTPSFFSTRKRAKLQQQGQGQGNKIHNRLQELLKKKKKGGSHGEGREGAGGGGGGGAKSFKVGGGKRGRK
jgi:hypothetical protein